MPENDVHHVFFPSLWISLHAQEMNHDFDFIIEIVCDDVSYCCYFSVML